MFLFCVYVCICIWPGVLSVFVLVLCCMGALVGATLAFMQLPMAGLAMPMTPARNDAVRSCNVVRKSTLEFAFVVTCFERVQSCNIVHKSTFEFAFVGLKMLLKEFICRL